MKRILRYTKYVLVSIFSFLIIYLIAVFVLPLIVLSKGEENDSSKKDVPIFVLTNGVHTDIGFPVRNDQKDWTKEIPLTDIISKDTTYNYITFGWGDQGAFLDMPTWDDLTFKLAITAATGMGKTAMHTEYYKNLEENDTCKLIWISSFQYEKLIAFVSQRFMRDASGRVINIKTDAQYSTGDAFYEANGRYSIFYSCNTWVNNALKVAGLEHCLWTVLSDPILDIYTSDN